MPSLPMNPDTTEATEKNNAAVTEFAHGRGMHADPSVSEDMHKGGMPYAPPQPHDLIMEMQAIKRMDTNDPGAQPDPYVEGNPDRYGAQRPLVREIGTPRTPPLPEPEPRRFKRAP